MEPCAVGRIGTDGEISQEKTNAMLRKKMVKKVQRCKRKSVAVSLRTVTLKGALAIQIQSRRYLPMQRLSMEGIHQYSWMPWMKTSRNLSEPFQRMKKSCC